MFLSTPVTYEYGCTERMFSYNAYSAAEMKVDAE